MASNASKCADVRNVDLYHQKTAKFLIVIVRKQIIEVFSCRS
jgi:hypothetical protein